MAEDQSVLRKRNVGRASESNEAKEGDLVDGEDKVEGGVDEEGSLGSEEEDLDEVDMYTSTARERRKKKVRARLPFFKRLGATIESSEIQVIIVLLILIDMVAALVQIFAKLGQVPFFSGSDSMVRFLEYTSVFTVIIFLFEILLAFVAFGLRTLSHPGYVVDVGIVCTQFFMSAAYGSIAVRLLGVFRFWRVVRLSRDMVAQIESAHTETLSLLEEERDRNDDLLAQLRGKNEDLRREIDRRSRVQEMLKSYKEEVETLQEALFIAAQTTATDAANLLPPETIESLTAQYSAIATSRKDESDRNSLTKSGMNRPSKMIVDEDGQFRKQ
jgi:hypothetical protein